MMTPSVSEGIVMQDDDETDKHDVDRADEDVVDDGTCRCGR